MELPQPAAPQVLPRDEEASLVGNYAALPRGVVVCTQEQVLPSGLNLGTFAGHVLGAHPQQLVSTTDAVLTLFVDRNDVDRELPPLARLVTLKNVHLNSWFKRKAQGKSPTRKSDSSHIVI